MGRRLSIVFNGKQLDALDVFCSANHLHVNVIKTKSMHVTTRQVEVSTSTSALVYRGVAISNVAKFKYVGVWIDERGSCDVQAMELIKKATSSMYYCMSKARRIVFRCPSKLRVTLFKAHVSPLFTYACEVTPYSRKQIECMNKVVHKYARWCTGLPLRTCTQTVLREAGLRPVHYDFLSARLNYFLLLMSRDEQHVTRLALADLQSRDSTSAYSRWYSGIVDAFDKLACRQLLNAPIDLGSGKKVIKQLINTLWYTEGGASMQSIELQDKFTFHLRNIGSTDQCLDAIFTTRVNVLALPACRIAVQTQVVDALKYGGLGRHHLASTIIKRYEQEAISCFRSGVAPGFIHCHDTSIGISENRLKRVCPYCKHMYGMMYIHDVFHVLYVCPIVTAERVAMWSALGQKGGAYEWEAAKTVCDLAYSLLCPQSIEVACVVGRFLAAYLAALEMYNVASCDATLEKCSPRWLGGKTDVMLGMKVRIKSDLQSRV